ncbi:MAG TPA: hypothetical protein PKA63_01765 [Oligoflexia bacterium]|nr:hypothetical protein [Oligoflexia bacterium]HMP47377.1 hypothetical protein [Oligoflexia bacterium]
MNDISQAICDLVSILDKFNIRYFIGGSLSSSLNGIFRSTNDIDVVLENSINDLVVKELEEKFLVDATKLRESHSRNRAFNIFHENTALKFDLFPAYNDFHASQLDRAISVKLPSALCAFRVASPEDIILAKLVWISKAPSERQLSDIKGVLNTNRDSIDFDYLNSWAEKLKIGAQLKEIVAGEV